MTQIRKILDMVQRERLTREDAVKLLAALSGRLNFGKVTWEHLFELQREGEFTVEEVGALLESHAGLRAPPGSLSGLGDLLDGLPKQLGGLVDQAIRGRRPPAGGSILRFEINTSDGSVTRANVPLSLGAHLNKLLPVPALDALRANGLDPDKFQSMLDGKLPPGDLLKVEAPSGVTMRVWVE